MGIRAIAQGSFGDSDELGKRVGVDGGRDAASVDAASHAADDLDGEGTVGWERLADLEERADVTRSEHGWIAVRLHEGMNVPIGLSIAVVVGGVKVVPVEAGVVPVAAGVDDEREAVAAAGPLCLVHLVEVVERIEGHLGGVAFQHGFGAGDRAVFSGLEVGLLLLGKGELADQDGEGANEEESHHHCDQRDTTVVVP